MSRYRLRHHVTSTVIVSEEWRPVAGYEQHYEVSSEGRVRSLDREVTEKTGKRRKLAGKVLVPCRTGIYGAMKVTLSKEGVYSQRTVHRLVLEAFRGPCPPGHEACHNNGDASDNRLENLRWDTHLNNEQDKIRHGTHHQVVKTHCPQKHPLEFPNLVLHEANRGHRKCLSCARAHAYIQRNAHLKGRIQEVSDDFYRKLKEER